MMDHERCAQLDAANTTLRQRIADLKALVQELVARLHHDRHTSRGKYHGEAIFLSSGQIGLI